MAKTCCMQSLREYAVRERKEESRIGYDTPGQGKRILQGSCLRKEFLGNVRHRAGIGGKGKTVKEMLDREGP